MFYLKLVGLARTVFIWKIKTTDNFILVRFVICILLIMNVKRLSKIIDIDKI